MNEYEDAKIPFKDIVAAIDQGLEFRQSWGFFEGLACLWALDAVKDTADSFWWFILIVVAMTVWSILGRDLSNGRKIIEDLQ